MFLAVRRSSDDCFYRAATSYAARFSRLRKTYLALILTTADATAREARRLSRGQHHRWIRRCMVPRPRLLHPVVLHCCSHPFDLAVTRRARPQRKSRRALRLVVALAVRASFSCARRVCRLPWLAPSNLCPSERPTSRARRCAARVRASVNAPCGCPCA